MPRLHSNVAWRSALHCSGSSSACSFRHSEGRRPCLRTQSEWRRQSLSAERRCEQEEDMESGQGGRAVRRRRRPRLRSPTPSSSAFSLARSSAPCSRRAQALAAYTMPLPPILRALVRNTPTVAPVPHRAVISVTGSQAAQFLNGLTAASVPQHPHSHFYSAFLHAQVRNVYLLSVSYC